MNLRILAALAATVVLASCVGGGNDPVRLVSQLDYQNTAETRHSYTQYFSNSYVYSWFGSGAETINVGGDLAPRENLRHVLTDNGIEYYMGASRDGVGVDRLRNYERDLSQGSILSRLKPFTVQPILIFDAAFFEPENLGIFASLFGSFQILNDALPPEFQILLGDPRAPGQANHGEIMVNLLPPNEVAGVCSTGAAACAFPGFNRATMFLPDDFDTSKYTFPRKVIVHELLHALGIVGHVDSIEFPDSIMGTAGEFIPNPGYIISRIDREALQIMYMSQRTDLYNDWGEWSDTSHHLMGQSQDGGLQFGVALFNGLPQPWASGAMPNTYLKDNRSLFGTATWSGSLLGFSGPSPIAGDASLQVGLATLTNPDSEHDLRFRDIYFLNRFESADPWFSARNIDYRVKVGGNGFRNVHGEGYERGVVTGAFLGRNHEHMGGTVKRTDMVGAFGGSR